MSLGIDTWNATDNATLNATYRATLDAIEDGTRIAINTVIRQGDATRHVTTNSIRNILNEAMNELG